MPRKREFDAEQALHDAMSVFWEKGYSATSIEDLVAATGVNRYGLYDVYDSKRELYLAALRRYDRTVITRAILELERPEAGLDAIHTVFNRILRRVRSGNAKFGCLMCNAAEEVAPFDEDVARQVSTYQRRLAKAFGKAVANAQANGDVPRGVDSAPTGRYLAGLIQGVSYLARSQAGTRAIEDFVRVGLRVLE